MKKIALFIPSMYPSGGAERVTHTLATDLCATYDVTVITLAENSFENPMYNQHSLGFSHTKFSKLWSLLYGPQALRTYCTTNNIDLVVSQMERANFIAILAKIKTIAVVHNYKYLTSRFNSFFISRLYYKAHKVVTVSIGIQKRLEKLFSLTNVTTIYNYFDLEQIHTRLQESLLEEDQRLFTNGKYTFINIGRLTEQKGQDVLLDVFVTADIPNSQLLILGDGPDRNMLIEMSEASTKKNDVHFLGTRKNVFPLLQQADAFVLSSRWEGFGLVLVEALVAGLPIVSTNCKSGPSEILTPPGESFGTLVPVENHKLLAQAMTDLVGTSVDSEKQKNRANDFSKTSILPHWTELLES